MLNPYIRADWFTYFLPFLLQHTAQIIASMLSDDIINITIIIIIIILNFWGIKLNLSYVAIIISPHKTAVIVFFFPISVYLL